MSDFLLSFWRHSCLWHAHRICLAGIIAWSLDQQYYIGNRAYRRTFPFATLSNLFLYLTYMFLFPTLAESITVSNCTSMTQLLFPTFGEYLSVPDEFFYVLTFSRIYFWFRPANLLPTSQNKLKCKLSKDHNYSRVNIYTCYSGVHMQKP